MSSRFNYSAGTRRPVQGWPTLQTYKKNSIKVYTQCEIDACIRVIDGPTHHTLRHIVGAHSNVCTPGPIGVVLGGTRWPYNTVVWCRYTAGVFFGETVTKLFCANALRH